MSLRTFEIKLFPTQNYQAPKWKTVYLHTVNQNLFSTTLFHLKKETKCTFGAGLKVASTEEKILNINPASAENNDFSAVIASYSNTRISIQGSILSFSKFIFIYTSMLIYTGR